MNYHTTRSFLSIFGVLVLVTSILFGQGGDPDNPTDPPEPDPVISDTKVGQEVLDTSSPGVTIDVNYYTEGELYAILPRPDGVYKFYAEVTVTSGLDNLKISLEGMPGKPPMEAPLNSTKHFFEFTRSAFEQGDRNLQLTYRNRDTNKLLKAIPLSYTADFGSNTGASLTEISVREIPPKDNEYEEEEKKCKPCTYTDSEEEIKAKPGKGDKCAAGQTAHNPTDDKKVNAQTSAGQSDGGRAPAGLDHSTSDLSDSTSGDPSNLNPRTGADGQVTMHSSGNYPEKIETDTGTLKVTTATGGYDMAFYLKSDSTLSNAETELCVRRVDAGNNTYKLRFIEARYGTSVIECRYEQVVDGYKISGVTRGDLWTLYEGAEIASKDAGEALESAFLRKTVTQVDDIENSEIITISERAATSGNWVVVSKVKNYFGSETTGGQITKSILDYGNSNRERTWVYYPVTEGNELRAGFLNVFTEHTGDKTTYTYAADTGYLSRITTSFAEKLTGCTYDFTYNGAGYDVKVEKKISGSAVSQFYITSSSTGTTTTKNTVRSPSAGASPTAAGSLITSVTRYKTSTGPESNLTKEITFEDGTSQEFVYSTGSVTNPFSGTGTTTKITVLERELDSAGVLWTQTERDYICGVLHQVREYTHDLETYSTSRVAIRTTTYDDLDGLGRPKKTTVSFPGSTASANQVSSRLIGCCGLKSTTDHNGMVTTYHYDHLRRLETVEQSGVVQLNIYNGLEHVTASIDSASAPKNSHGYYTSRGVFSGMLVSSSGTRNLVGDATQSKKPSSRSGVEWETYTHTPYYYTTYTRDKVRRPDNQDENYHYYFDGKLKRRGGQVDVVTTYDYGPAIAGLSYPVNAVSATRTNAGGRWSATFYNFLGQVIQTSQSGGADSVLSYNAKGQLVSTTDPDGVKTLYDYDLRGKRTYVVLSLDNDYDIDDTVDRISVSDSYYVLVDNRYGMLTKSSIANQEDNASLLETNRSWSSLDGLHSFNKPFNDANLESTSTTALNGGGSWTVTANSAGGSVTVNTYTKGYLETSVTTGGGKTLSSKTYGRDKYKRVDSITDGRVDVTELTLAESGVVLTSKLLGDVGAADDILVTNKYNNLGQQYETVDPQGNSTYTAYNTKGRVTAVWGANTYARAYGYNSSGQMNLMHTFKDDSAFNATTPPTLTTTGFAKTEWIYDPDSGDLLEKKDDDGKGASYTYTDAGRLSTRTWARGKHTVYDYYSYGALKDVKYYQANATPLVSDPDTKDVSYTYDRLGRIDLVVQGANQHKYSYRPNNLSLEEELIKYDTNLNGTTVDFERTIVRTLNSKLRPLDWRINKTTPGTPPTTTTEHRVKYLYDGAGRFDGVEAAGISPIAGDPNGRDFRYTYEDFSWGLIDKWESKFHSHDNTWESYRDVLTRKVTTQKSNSEVYSEHDYEVNKIGQRDNYTQGYSAFGTQGSPKERKYVYGYNSRGELTSADYSDPTVPAPPTPINTQDRFYAFDGIGNRTDYREGTATSSGGTPVSYTTNDLNQYSGIDSLSPQYDFDGNATSYPIPEDQTANSTFTWDGENRLIKLVRPDAKVFEYRYDYLGRRYLKKSSTKTTCFLYDGWNLATQYNVTSSEVLEMRFTWGLDLSGSIQGAGGVGGLLCVERMSGQTSPGLWYPAYDGNGNITEYLTSGSYSTRLSYDPFGNVLADAGSIQDVELLPFQFSTKYTDKESGLLYYGYRYYDPVTGRWPSRDPVEEEGGINLYGMVGNELVRNVDVLGLYRFNREKYLTRGSCHHICKDRYLIGPGTTDTMRRHFEECKEACYKEVKKRGREYRKLKEYLKTAKESKFSICQRDMLEDGDCDCYTKAGNMIGGQHTYLQHDDGEGGVWGVGWTGGASKPTPEKAFGPDSCITCKYTYKPLEEGSGKGKAGYSASDDEIKDCLFKIMPSEKYKITGYNCAGWAREAAGKCGLSCRK